MVSIRIATAERRALRAVLATSLSLLLGVGLLGFGTSVAAAPAAADELPLVLSSEHLGMSADQIESTTRPPVAEEAPVVLTATGSSSTKPDTTGGAPGHTPTNTGSEFVSADGVVPAPVEASCEHAGMPGVAVSSFGDCIETSIRGGVGFEESARVCRVLFPEQG